MRSVLVFAAVAAPGMLALGPACARVAVAPVSVDRFSDAAFVALVGRYAPQGRVDYAAWKRSPADMAVLEMFVRQVAGTGPHNRPALFETRASRLAYWCTAYNAWVLYLVLDRWPLSSVRDVKSGVVSYFKPGAGFFWGTPIMVAGRTTTLHDLENDVIRKQGDPRVHFALNCASNSCPQLRAWHWTDEDLSAAAADFVNNPDHVRVLADAVELNAILDWYAEDFSTAGGVRAFLQRHAAPALATQLQQANGRPLRFLSYDWGVNAAR